jgi:hypothetical protein
LLLRAECRLLETFGVAQMKRIPWSILNFISDPASGEELVHPVQRRIFRPTDRSSRAGGGLRYSNVRRLIEDGVIENDWRGAGDALAISGSGQLALSDFCADVLVAWDRLRARTGAVDAAAGYPATQNNNRSASGSASA